jgi:acetyl-CoA C-acetyltransferase
MAESVGQAYVIDAVRTAIGKRNGSLAGVHPVDLGAAGWRALFDRNDVDPGAVDDVIAGCVDAIGPQAGNIARLSWLAAGFPEEVPGVTVDRQCGSSQQAISFGAQAIMSGTADLIVAGGMQNMSQIPISSAMTVAEQFGFTSPTNESKSWLHRYGDQEISQFRGAELIAEKWDITREDMEQYALTSHQRAQAAIRAGHFDNEIVEVDGFRVSRPWSTVAG